MWLIFALFEHRCRWVRVCTFELVMNLCSAEPTQTITTSSGSAVLLTASAHCWRLEYYVHVCALFR